MKRTVIEILDRETYKCPTCQQEEADTSTEDTVPADGEFKRAKSTSVRKLKILQLNIDCLSTNLEELKALLRKHKIDVFAIQETKMIIEDKDPSVPGYAVKRWERSKEPGGERGGGLLVGIKSNIPYHPKETKIMRSGGIVEAYTFEIPLADSQKIRITNIYAPPVRNAVDTFQVTDWPHDECDLIIGDPNAHSKLWDLLREADSDSRGKMLEKWMDENDMACLNDGRPTHVNRQHPNTASPTDPVDNTSNPESTPGVTSPDVSIAHVSLLDKLTWDVLNDMRSDHQPIIITLNCGVEEVNSTPSYKWNFKRAEWGKYAEAVDKQLPTYYKRMNLNKLEKRFRKTLLKAAKTHIGKKKIDNRSKSIFTKEIKEAIHERNRLKDTLGGNRGEWLKACDKTREMIKEEKTKRWKEYVESLDATTPSTEIWNAIRNLDGRRKPQIANEALEVDGTYYTSDHDKANQFAKTYKGFAKLPVRKEDRQLRKKNRRRLKKKPSMRDTSEKPLEMEELEKALAEAHNNKAAGDDDIPYELLKHLGPHAKEILLHMFERVWQGEELPPKWRTAVIRPLLKDGKDPKLTVSFRPISLTSCLGKLLEKIITNRLVYVLETRGLLNDNQAGFRQGRCTTDQVLKLVQHATDQIQNKDRSSKTIATFFDYEKAYDKVWRDGLIKKMLDMDIPQRFIIYVRHFLSGRKTWVDVNGVKSDVFRLDEGLPQGSAISPLLFLIFINDIDVDLDDNAVASLFADDTAKWVRDRSIPGMDCRKLMQEEVDKLLAWADKWKMKVNASKTKVLVFSSSNKDRNWDPNLTANGVKIKTVNDYPFLGVSAEGGLRSAKQIDKIVIKCKKRVNIMRCLATKDWGNSLETQRTTYLQYVRMPMEYASPSWRSWASATNIERL